MSPTARELIAHLRSLRNERNIAGMKRFGISSRHELLGVGAVTLRRLARAHRRDHALAQELWASGIHEAMGLATIVDDPKQVTQSQVERWVRDCDNWAQTDACAFLLFASNKVCST